MEAQQSEEQTSQRAYGEGFRQGVTRVLEELDKLSFIPKEVRETLTANAAKLCLVEAIAEKQAEELKQRALKEWQTQAPELKATAERFIKRWFPNAPTGGAPVSPPNSPAGEDAKPEA